MLVQKTIRIEENLLEKIETVSQEKKITSSDFIRQILSDYVDSKEKINEVKPEKKSKNGQKVEGDFKEFLLSTEKEIKQYHKKENNKLLSSIDYLRDIILMFLMEIYKEIFDMDRFKNPKATEQEREKLLQKNIKKLILLKNLK